MELIATQDMLNGIKNGDRFEAPDTILVALGLATVPTSEPVAAVPSPTRPTRRRPVTTPQP